MRCRLCRYMWEIKRCVHCGGVMKSPDHPGGVALIKQKSKRLGCEPMRMH